MIFAKYNRLKREIKRAMLTNYWYINRIAIALIMLCFLAVICIMATLEMLCNLITN